MPEIKQDNPGLVRRIPVSKDKLEDPTLPIKTVSNLEEVKAAEIKLRQAKLIADAKKDQGEDEYHHKIALRLKGWL